MSGGRKSVATWGIAFLLIGLSDFASAESRIWTDNQGRQVRAEFVRMAGSDVVLKQPSGQVARVPLATLSEADRQFLRTLLTSEGVRLWTSIDGRQIQAKYLRVRDGQVYVNFDGATTSFPLERLSVADRLFVREAAVAAGQADELPEVSDDEKLPAARQWTDADGTKAVGQFERILPDGRVLLAVAGITRLVEVEKLSEEDHDYLRELLEGQPAARLIPAKPEPPPLAEPPPDLEPETETPVTPPAPPPPPPIPPRPQPRPQVQPQIQPPIQPAPAARPSTSRSEKSAPSGGGEIDLSISPNTARAMFVIGGIMHLVGLWWMGAVALQNGNTVFGVLCFLCCGIAALIYGFMNTEIAGVPLALIIFGIAIKIIAEVLVIM